MWAGKQAELGMWVVAFAGQPASASCFQLLIP